MVKNKKGGRHHKKMSSKHSKDTGYTIKLRLPSVEGEVIASVLQLYGQGNVNVMCDDGRRTAVCHTKKIPWKT